MSQTCEIRGTVEKITFYNAANGFAVVEFNTGDEMIPVVGTLFDVRVGEDLRLTGSYEEHASFGRQFKATAFERCPPATAAAMLRYLSSGGIKGIGPVLAGKLIDRFGAQTLEVIEKEPLRLTAIRGISREKALAFQAAYLKQIGVRELIAFASQYGISSDESMKIYHALGPGSIVKMKENPYVLCCERLPFSFQRVDDLAAQMGFEPGFGQRLFSGIEFVLRHNLSNGHTCLPWDKLIEVSARLLGQEEQTVNHSLSSAVASGRLKCFETADKRYVFLPEYYDAESDAARRLHLLLFAKGVKLSSMEKKIAAVERELSLTFEQRQLDAIRAVADTGLLVLTGGPGTGKTTTLNAVIRVFESAGLKVGLTAPTGRAAKRMCEVTGHEAMTIHRLLEASFDDSGRSVFARNVHNPLPVDLLIVDEVSMIDSLLFDRLLQALPFGCRLILVGDADQLPSVGAGNVLRDLMESGCVPTVELTTVFRQAMQSAIITSAHSVNRGEMPDLTTRDSDFFFLPVDSPRKVADTVEQLVTRRLPEAYGYSSLSDIQVLSPSRKMEVGTASLNARLQSVLNPPDKKKREMVFASGLLRQGDKVMQIRNNYDILWKQGSETGSGVFNGDVGELDSFDPAAGIFTVRYEDRVATYSAEDADQLELAYAITVHKSQGSEYPCVVLPISDMPPQLCYRNLLYTALTRARDLLVVVGSKERLAQMIANDRRVKRYSMLREMLREESR